MKTHSPRQPTHEQIATAAFLIWEQAGKPHGQDAAHWFQAEQQLKADCAHDAGALRRIAPAGAKRTRQTRRAVSEPVGV